MPDHHHCIGAPLARVEGESIFSHLLEHFPGIGCLSFVEREARKRFEGRLGVDEAIDSLDLGEYSERSKADRAERDQRGSADLLTMFGRSARLEGFV
ncbi:hypothetical protein [Saccharopolyspora elongata]|uniref:Uncharacterized protein n=1 Tax=Saccharopolyspora elongata TaxID=2530387 RepID=A0A4R4XWZ4_9PSEU|nr:hypothetical protein [Saccharopolyspora elongata]TDD36271.1 hypothetical protein E1288_42190 [Saccharopolyspora elongata]